MTEVPNGEMSRQLHEERAIAFFDRLGAAEPVYTYDFDSIRDQVYQVGIYLQSAAEGLLRLYPGFAEAQEADGSVLERGMGGRGLYDRWIGGGKDAPVSFSVQLPMDNGLYSVTCDRQTTSFSTLRSADRDWLLDNQMSVDSKKGTSIYMASAGAWFTLDHEDLFWVNDTAGRPLFDHTRLTKAEADISRHYTTLGLIQYHIWQASQDFRSAVRGTPQA